MPSKWFYPAAISFAFWTSRSIWSWGCSWRPSPCHASFLSISQLCLCTCHSLLISGISPNVLISFNGSQGPHGRSLLPLAKQVFELHGSKICSDRAQSGCSNKMFLLPGSLGTLNTPSGEHLYLCSDSFTPAYAGRLEVLVEQGLCPRLSVSAA